MRYWLSVIILAAMMGVVNAQSEKGVRIPGVPETNNMPLPPGYQQPNEMSQDRLTHAVPSPNAEGGANVKDN